MCQHLATCADDCGLSAFEIAREEARTAGIGQETHVDPIGLVDLLRRAGLIRPDVDNQQHEAVQDEA